MADYMRLLVLRVILSTFLMASSSSIETNIDTRTLPESKFNVSAIYVFGDSTVDPGNNNLIITAFKSNFPPYGRDFIDHIPTGRFTNGKLATDFIASYVGLKEQIPAYLDPTLSEKDWITGVSFASAGSGYDPLTSKISDVIPIAKQLDYFRDYVMKLEYLMGKVEAKNHLRRAGFILSAGTNDFVISYYMIPIKRSVFSSEEYEQFILGKLYELLQGLYSLGARRIAVVGLPPMGCLPIVRTLFSGDITRGCVDSLNGIALDYNSKLQAGLISLDMKFADDDGKIVYAEIYPTLADVISSPEVHGFEEATRGCCGTGLIEGSFMCNPGSLACLDASKFVFWDSIHPSQRTYYILFKSILPIIDLLFN